MIYFNISAHLVAVSVSIVLATVIVLALDLSTGAAFFVGMAVGAVCQLAAFLGFDG